MAALLSFYLLLSVELSDTQVYEPYTRALLGTASYFCEVLVLKLRRVATCLPDWLADRLKNSLGEGWVLF